MIMVFSNLLGNVAPISAAVTTPLAASTSSTASTITATFEIINDLAETMTSLKLSPSGKNTWGKEQLTKPLNTGASIKIPVTYDSTKLKWDIKAVTSNGEQVFESLDFTGIKAETGGNIHLRYNMTRDLYGVVYNNAGPSVAGLAAGNNTTTVIFKIVNNTKGEYETLQLSKTTKNTWGPNLLSAPLKGGAEITIPITFSSDSAIWDFKGVSYDAQNFTAKSLDFSTLTPSTGGKITINYTMAYGMSAVVSNNVIKTPYPKQSGNNIMFYDTDTDGIFSAEEAKEQVEAANPDLTLGYTASFSDKINTIGKNAFERRGVKKLIIPSTIKTIQDEAFMNTDLLTEVTFAEGIQTIGNRSFLKASLTNIVLPKSVRTLGDGAFGNCEKIASVTLNEGLTGIGVGAFTGTLITQINLPQSLVSIGSGAFTKCEYLKSVNIPSGIKRIEDRAFNGCGKLTDINLPAVTYIGDQAFLGCKSLTKIQIPATLNSIGFIPFDGCVNLSTINLDSSNPTFATQDGILYSKNFDAIYTYPIARTSKTLVLPSTVVTIKAGALAKTNLEEITLPAGLKTIERYGFGESTSLKSISLPSGLTTIDVQAFMQCTSMAGDLVIPESVKTMGIEAFRSTDIKKLTINSSIDLSLGVFSSCEKLDTVIINGSFEKISEGAFAFCSKLIEIGLPKNLKTIETRAFAGCSSLPTINLPSNLQSLGATIPITTGIDRGVFYGCTSLSNITIPNSVIYVEDCSFEGCTSLKTATLSTNSKYTLLEARLFEGCTSLDSITIPKNVLTIGEEAFANSGLTKIKITPNGCKTIGQSAFKNSKLIEVNLPVGVKTLGYLSFANIDTLKKVTLGSTITVVPPFTFYKVANLTRVDIISLKKIDIAAFNLEDAAFKATGRIHVPKNFVLTKSADGKYYLKGRRVLKDLPTLAKGKAGY